MSDDRRSPDWDVRTGAGNLLALVGAQGLGTVAAFLVTWLATRALGPHGYGELAAALIAVQLIAALSIEWTSIALWRYGCEEFVESGRVSIAFWTRLLVVGVTLAIIAAVSPWLLSALGGRLQVPAGVRSLVLFYLAVFVLWQHAQRTLQAVKLPRLAGALIATERSLLLVQIGVLWLAHAASLNRVVVAYIVSPLVPLSIAFWYLRALIPLPRAVGGERVWALLRFSIPFVPSTVASTMSTIQLDALFIARYLSVSALGAYAIASQVSAGVMLVPQQAGLLLFSFFVTSQAAGREDLLAYYFTDLLPPLTLLWSLVCALAAATGVYLLPVVFGAGFGAIASVLWPLMAASALGVPVTMGYGHLSNARSTTYMSAVTSGISAAVNIVLDMLLIPKYGLLGSAWGSVAASAAYTLTWLVLAGRLTNGSIQRVLVALVPPVAGAAWATISGNNFEALALALGIGCLIALPQVRTVTEHLRRAAEIGVPIPAWMMTPAVKAEQL